MKFNFWQILGLVLIVVGVVFFARNKMSTNDVAPANGPGKTPPVTTPAEPSTAPATTEPAAAAAQ